MPSDTDVEPLPVMATANQEFAFVSWDGSNGRKACPLATFGSREPQVRSIRLACAEPPRADQPELKNAAELRGAIALVVRGGCSFAHKARLLQRAGAVAMLLANNTREEPLAAFTMGESSEELEDNKKNLKVEPIAIPCVMMCLRDVRELFQKFPPSVKNGVLNFEILESEEGAVVAETCLKEQRLRHGAAESGKGWKAIKRTTTSIIKLLEPQNTTASDTSVVEVSSLAEGGGRGDEKLVESGTDTTTTREKQPPLLAFVQWATSSSTYEICFAPLSDFCTASAGASYMGKLVACDPLPADKPLRNAAQLSGSVALLRRGSCSFPEKLERVQRAGAVAAIVCNDDEQDLDAAFVMSVDHIDAANATLPAVMISHNTFLRIQPALNVSTARILCLAGDVAVDALLASSGKSVSFINVPTPIPNQVPAKNPVDAVPDLVFDLHVACHEGDHGACQRVLARLEDDEAKRKLMNTSNLSNGLTALHHACAGGNDNVVELLLQLGAAPDALDLALQTPLHVACAASHVQCARLLLRAEGATSQVPTVLYNADEEYGGLAITRHIGGATAMHEAARAGSAECIELLLACNARTTTKNEYVFLGVNAQDVEGRTPLHMACEAAHPECVMYLVAANADVNIKDYNGRSPLFVTCEGANNSTKEAQAGQIAAKLICSGAEVQEEETDVVTRSELDQLLLDRIESPALRRELEVVYLKHEARKTRVENDQLRKENEAVNDHLRALETKFDELQSQIIKQEQYRQQLEQLQLQFQMILHFQSCSKVPSSSTERKISEIFTTIATDKATDKKEQELALDAALARDLGKRCHRLSQFLLAEQYFQQSLELFPLPGVRRLLEMTRKTQKPRDETENPSSLANGSPCLISDAVYSTTKCARIQQLHDLRTTIEAAPQARALLDRELSKLDAFSEDDKEFPVSCRWVEWLLSLPWGESSFGLRNDELYTIKRSEFECLDTIDACGLDRRRNQAARTIQCEFRKQYAARLSARVTAATRLQAVVKGNCVRRRYTKEKQTTRAVALTNSQESGELVRASDVDYTATVDPAIAKRLPHHYSVKELVVGRLIYYKESKMRVVQLVKCAQRGLLLQDKTKATGVYLVWTRWGTDLDTLCQASLSGPYDTQEDAQRRFNRITREEKSRYVSEHDVHEDSMTYESGFPFLRDIGDSRDSVASA